MNKMKAKTILTTILILLASLQLSAQKVKYPETPVFQDPKTPGLREVYFTQDDTDIHNFLYSYDLIYRIPYCVAYMLQPHQLKISNSTHYSSDWYYDNAIMYSYQSADWASHLPYVRYSLIPITHRNTPESMRQTRMRTLTVPADPYVVQYLLTPLDSAIRSWASRSDILYISAGTIQGPQKLTDKEGHAIQVPRGIYKVIVRRDGNKYSGVAFLVPNYKTRGDTQLRAFALPIGQLEDQLKIQFFSGLPADVLRDVRSQNPLENLWWWR